MLLSKLYFLKLRPDLPDYYLQLSYELQKFQVTIIPIDIRDLLSFLHKEKKIFVFTESINLKNKDLFNTYIVPKIYTPLSNAKMVLLHLTSFSAPIKLSRFIKNRLYRMLNPPLDIIHLAKHLALEILEDLNTDVQWPGGKRNAPYKILFDKKGF